MAGKESGEGGEGGLRAFLDGGALDRAEAAVRRGLADRPTDPRLLRNLGDVLRQKGDLRGAAEAYRRLSDARPGDRHAERMAALLDGGPSRREDPHPAKFFLARDFLTAERHAEVLAAVRRRRRKFQSTAVRTDKGKDRKDAATRRSQFCADVAGVQEWFDAKVLQAFPEICRRTGVEPFEPRILSCKFSAWHDGCFFRLHQDQATGIAATRRLGFLYYFRFPPPRFRGGELLLYDRDPDTLWPRPSFTAIPPEDNLLAVIPANAWHEVLPVRVESDDWYAARFTYGGWIHDAALVDGGEEE
jgi:Rps23 Pro-64 3,4-dihydroxylase Tpa1-like proline 4-hydroxylase